MIPNQPYFQIPLQFFGVNSVQEPTFIRQDNLPFQMYGQNTFFHHSTHHPKNYNPAYFYDFLGNTMQRPYISSTVIGEERMIEKLDNKSQVVKINIEQKSQISHKKQAQKIVLEGCICAKTGCIKEYCRCYKSGKACTQQCRCHHCRNLIDREIQVNKKSKSQKDKKCNCKKSKCSNKYCQCLVAGLTCGKQCDCKDCKNH